MNFVHRKLCGVLDLIKSGMHMALGLFLFCGTADVDTTGISLDLIDLFSPQALIRVVSKETSLYSVANV